MLAVASDRGLSALRFIDPSERAECDAQGAQIAKPARSGHAHLDHAERQVAAFFSGELREFDLPLDLAGSEFQLAAWKALLAIPYGETRSYQQQAAGLQRVGGARAVGRANAVNPVAIIVPCHRVIRADGHLCGYGGGLWRKQWLLEHERRVLGAGQMSLPLADLTGASS